MTVPDVDYFLSKAIGNETNPASAMRYHYMRLSSYKKWPNSAYAFPSHLASAGFYYEGNGSEVVCFSCDGNIADWIWEDIPMDKHRRRFPSCLFINGQDETNVPFDLSVDQASNLTESLSPVSDDVKNILINNQRSPRNQEQHDSSEVDRSSTETTSDAITSALMNNNVSSSASAKVSSSNSSPIFPESMTSRVNHCATSTIQLQSRNSASAFEIRTTSVDSTHVAGNLTDADFGIITDRPKHPDYAIEFTRLQSYKRWPTQMKQTPLLLSIAGFFYSGRADSVKCFFCNGGLRNWEPEDDPWVEHARWFPKCGYVKLMKGEEYIENVALIHLGSMENAEENGQTFPCHRPSIETHINITARGARHNANETKYDRLVNEENLTDIKAIRKENEDLKRLKVCKICLEDEVSFILDPCGHFCCASCKIMIVFCPICRTRITNTIHFYRS